MADASPAPAAASPPAGAPVARTPRVTLRFRVPYATVWGENLVLCGDDERLGAWEPARGSWMQCTHVGDQLIWQARPRADVAHAPPRGARGRGAATAAARGPSPQRPKAAATRADGARCNGCRRRW